MCYPNEATQILTWKSMRIPGHWVRAKYYRKDFPMLITVNFPNAWIQAPNHAGFPLHGFPQGFRTHNCTGAGPSFSYLWFISYVCPSFGRKRQPCENYRCPLIHCVLVQPASKDIPSAVEDVDRTEKRSKSMISTRNSGR